MDAAQTKGARTRGCGGVNRALHKKSREKKLPSSAEEGWLRHQSLEGRRRGGLVNRSFLLNQPPRPRPFRTGHFFDGTATPPLRRRGVCLSCDISTYRLFRGLTPVMEFAIISICLGVIPQHPPTIFTQPFAANSLSTSAVSSGLA
jgi:hypothetical protein